MQVVAFSTPLNPAWRWRIVSYSGEQVEESREEFLSIAAHELKTPLTSLTLALQVLAQETHAGGTPSQVQLAQVGDRQGADVLREGGERRERNEGARFGADV